MEKPVILIIGTRPDALKLISLYKELKKAGVSTFLCATYQHNKLLDQVLEFFNITPDVSLNIMKENQTLEYVTSSVLKKTTDIFSSIKPQLVIVQGDTTSSFASALSAFYLNIPVAHVEAGLRTGNIGSPFPEEINRIFIDKISSLHFAPTPINVLNLLKDGISYKQVFCVGNTIVDTLFDIRKKIDSGVIAISKELQYVVKQCRQQKKRMVLLTIHRRESFGDGISKVLHAIAACAREYKDMFVVFPVHPNPRVHRAVQQTKISELSNVYCTEPLDYQDLIFLLTNVDWVMTDSGGIQEEASSLGKHVIILRRLTERSEVIWDGGGKIAGTDPQIITDTIKEWIQTKHNIKPRFTYGDGKTSKQIVSIVLEYLSLPATMSSHSIAPQVVQDIHKERLKSLSQKGGFI